MTDSDTSTASGPTDIKAELENESLELSFSDDSSFYGADGVRRICAQQVTDFNDSDYWRLHEWNIQVITMRENKSKSSKRKRGSRFSSSDEPDFKKSKLSVELLSHSKEISDELYNPYEGYPTALQIGESVDDFLRRLRPSAPEAEPWVWCANFRTTYRDTDCRLAEFKQIGTGLLEQYTQKRKSLEESFDPPKNPGSITRLLQPDREQLQSDILHTAKRCGVTAGKWMLFATKARVDQVWTAVVRGTVDGRWVSAKVSTKPCSPNNPTHVICIYAKEFDDQDDLKRILKELIRLKLALAVHGPLQKGSGNVQSQIYFKADAYTWLDIMSDNEYQLKASMHSTASLLTRADLLDLR